jgi:hypothetical protein
LFGGEPAHAWAHLLQEFGRPAVSGAEVSLERFPGLVGEGFRPEPVRQRGVEGH